MCCVVVEGFGEQGEGGDAPQGSRRPRGGCHRGLGHMHCDSAGPWQASASCRLRKGCPGAMSSTRTIQIWRGASIGHAGRVGCASSSSRPAGAWAASWAPGTGATWAPASARARCRWCAQRTCQARTCRRPTPRSRRSRRARFRRTSTGAARLTSPVFALARGRARRHVARRAGRAARARDGAVRLPRERQADAAAAPAGHQARAGVPGPEPAAPPAEPAAPEAAADEDADLSGARSIVAGVKTLETSRASVALLHKRPKGMVHPRFRDRSTRLRDSCSFGCRVRHGLNLVGPGTHNVGSEDTADLLGANAGPPPLSNACNVHTPQAQLTWQGHAPEIDMNLNHHPK